MEISCGLVQDDIVVGNAYNKYATRNPLARFLVNRFIRTLDKLVAISSPLSIHEIGCGEGFLTLRWKKQGMDVRGSDFSQKVIEIARENAMEQEVSPDIFKIRSVYDLDAQDDGADLLVCCEVLEHLENPSAALEIIASLAPRFALFSVPHEPLWRTLNVLRGKYLREWGNSPGHVQHWSRKEFIALLQSFFSIVEVRTPLPWTVVLCRIKNAST